MKINLNERCTVTLTEEGALHWTRQYYCIPAKHRPPVAKAGDVVKTQLWCLFQVFGPHVHIGMGSVYFEGNDIEFDSAQTYQQEK